jgi:ATP-dependent protease ClpP protease subunit
MRGKPLNVRINSGGGIADEGVAIYNTLKNHDGKITVYVDGIAASAASLIAMAGEDVVMRTGSVMMVHDPMMLSIGNADDMEKAVEALNAIGDSMAALYSEKTGRKATDIRAEMRDELWLTPSEAIAKGYANRTDAETAIEASAFDYRAYTKTPEPIMALSDSRAWSNRLKAPKAAAGLKQEPPMADMISKEAAATEAAALVKEASEKAATEATKTEQERTTGIIEACTKADVMAMAAALIKDGSTVEQAKARIDGAKGIKEAVALAHKQNQKIELSLADEFIAAGTSIETVRSKLFEKISAAEAAKPTRSAHQAKTGGDDIDNVVSLWDKQVEKVNARQPMQAA